LSAADRIIKSGHLDHLIAKKTNSPEHPVSLSAVLMKHQFANIIKKLPVSLIEFIAKPNSEYVNSISNPEI